MRSVTFSDQTMLTAAARAAGFRQKLEAARKLDHLGLTCVEMPKLSGQEADVLLMRSLCSTVKRGVLALHTGITVDDVKLAWEAIKGAEQPRLIISMPLTSAQLEYIAHLKPPKAIERIAELMKAAKALCGDVEFVCGDATRAELPYMKEAIQTAVKAGAARVTLEDAAGLSLPEEIAALVKEAKSVVGDLPLSVRCGNELGLAISCAVAALQAGADEIKTAYNDETSLSAAAMAKLLRSRGADLQLESTLNVTRVDRTAGELDGLLTAAPGKVLPTAEAPKDGDVPAGETLAQAIASLGYELDEADMAHVQEAVERESKGRALNRAELEAIVLSVAQQVPPTYRVKSYLVNSGNAITPTAHVALDKNGETLTGLCAGDGPIDAAFLAIEQIIGRHFEMDDFQIAAVTQDRDAMGDALVKLRHGGKVYAGHGISTDIIGAAIRAYLNALNKIAYEEKTV